MDTNNKLKSDILLQSEYETLMSVIIFDFVILKINVFNWSNLIIHITRKF